MFGLSSVNLRWPSRAPSKAIQYDAPAKPGQQNVARTIGGILGTTVGTFSGTILGAESMLMQTQKLAEIDPLAGGIALVGTVVAGFVCAIAGAAIGAIAGVSIGDMLSSKNQL